LKTIKWFTDTETTGLLKELEQILTFSVVLEKQAKTEQAYEMSILLKDNVIPSPGALLVNKINPFATQYKSSAVQEYLAYEHLKKLFQDHIQSGHRVVMIAYNLEFDDIMYKDLFAKFGDDLNKYISVRFDPLTTVKQLLAQGKIETKEIQTTYSKSYKSAKLEDVYIALGYDSSSFKAHTALDDTLMLQMVAHGVYLIATGKKLDEMNAAPETYTTGQIVHIITDDEKLGLSKKYLKVLVNDIENQRLLALDEQMTSATSAEGAVRYVPYGEILDEAEVVANNSNKLESYYNQHQQIITEAANALLNKKESKKALEKDFSLVVTLAQKMLAAESKKKIIQELTPEEIEILPQAESYSFGKYNKGWSREIHGPNYLTKIQEIKLSTALTLGLDPFGVYRLIENKNEILVTEKKTELQDKIIELMQLDKTDEKIKALFKQIPPIAKFKNDKHPKKILEEFDNKKAEVFQGADKFKKDLLTDLLNYLKKKSPEVFEEVQIPSFKLDLSSLLKKKQ
jgi:hypothetical protein